MISVEDKIVLITGASSGIGESCANIFAQAGANLILAARRQEKLEKLADELTKKFQCKTYLLKLDVRDRLAVESAINSLPDPWKNLDILINNAGLSRGLDKLHVGDFNDWEEMIDTNVKGLLYMTRYVVPGMVNRSQGHVVNIGSIAGRGAYPGGNVYCASKAAVRAISEGLKQDLLGTPVRVTEIQPGLVETEFSNVRFHGDTEKAKNVYKDLTPLTGDDIADLVFFCVTRSPHVNISELLVVPTDQANATMVHRHQ
ncbi:MAG: SDR family oxidoreductase [Okeania sp. SIO2G4]|uniref:SDR family oxidoreductase n=1 Tax=unclassified Okeania TaxID=2634635 RepID=UPI0013BE4D55|nr:MULTISPECIES: SDR family oxidoreductase [unclassified Okeania]NEP07192.1 SDR family oxidoreductase [Okeania sp. SIO4D6]NEP44558.1 SDR family oxidoreductase [Okeania sp. SIO2H7]NEP75311.1 SDR family oxidoreductase [Okeania sp. SIO2G5]NEP96389.1 SDR family oxidoreductase [Okeania sp. SIO2F5]NEQ94174.1 SDR family oxidoreductase [Okeania sp. SIO2G4]